MIERADFDVAEGERLAVEGAERAADHADRVRFEWKLKAAKMLAAFLTHLNGREFLTEDLRVFAYEHDLEAPPEERAWGAVIKAAHRKGVIEHVGLGKAKDKKVHASINHVWRATGKSLVEFLAELPEEDASPDGKRFPLQMAMKIAARFKATLKPHCALIEIVGSIRRQKPFVKDIEILLVSMPGSIKDPNDFFNHSIPRPAACIALDDLLKRGIIAKRPNVKGHLSWGDENKLAVHLESGMPVDFFFTTADKWFNSLVVRTGPKQSNQAIASAAIAKGWHWHAYGDGFTRNDGKNSIDRHRVESEADAFHFVNLPFVAPEKR